MKKRDISDFTDNEFRQQASNANFSRLSNLMGFKPTANKVLNTVMMKNLNSWQKVEVVSNITALETLYMGGSSNIDGVCVNACADYVGSNNLPLLDSKGDFGARLDSQAAASRYIFTKSSGNFDKVFNKVDLKILPRYNFEGKDIEYKFLTFNIPMLLVNGSEGMGSGYSQKILPRSVDNVKKYIKAYLNKTKLPKLPVHYNGFNGTIEENPIAINQWIITGVIERVSASKLKIVEVPIGESYKSMIKKMDILVDKDIIKRYDDLCDPKTDKFLFNVSHSIQFGKLSDEQIIEKLKLKAKISENFTIIDENNSVKVHHSAEEVFNHYIEVKLKYLQMRKDYLIISTDEDIRFDFSKYTFIKAIVDEKLKISKRKKKAIEIDLSKIDNILKRDDSYEYLLGMSINSLTVERMNKLLEDIKQKKSKLDLIKKTTITNMWLDDIKDIKG